MFDFKIKFHFIEYNNHLKKVQKGDKKLEKTQFFFTEKNYPKIDFDGSSIHKSRNENFVFLKLASKR